ncbi:nuclear transport factor 2 family protein [Paracrocinitomix mangrovi]|uniref:nuclear transport factor 2 family protein n=1 Tax=Paracrocinitomix mangrovi TaxID=2862509 RepID=UPI001C8EF117|nr:nuclear transport factor 2 family protein [Paracrocinitomix mangrovi]UKN01738.1 nuclear transport factor 2 family protein [Paracrocinitomix mangrovi]
MRNLLTVIAFFGMHGVYAQTTSKIETERFYEYLNKGDSVSISAMLSETATIQHVEGDSSFSFNKEGFLGICSKFRSGKFKEEIEIVADFEEMYSQISTVTVFFKFYLNGELNHCGTDLFIWNSTKTGHKIEQVISTPCDCKQQETEQEEKEKYLKTYLDEQMVLWHAAASNSDFDAYFDFMADDFYYLGTDPNERWSKEEFGSFCKPYFEKKKGWDFKTISRNWYLSDDMKMAWFDEKMDTWMEDCRGSGVLVQVGPGNWKLLHYNLTVLIENEKIKDFMNLRKSKLKTNKK